MHRKLRRVVKNMRVYVVGLQRWHAIAAAAVVLLAILTAALWPRPSAGEGGYAETFYSTSQALPVTATADEGALLCIIIDDFGSGRDGVRQMMDIDAHLTFAVLPYGPFTTQDAEAAHEKGYEVIVHLPMEPMHGSLSWLGPNAILCSQDSDKISALSAMALHNVPYAVGANVHMGSKASADGRVMESILNQVAAADMFFVDSRTGDKSVIPAIAQQLAVPCLERNVFLDGQQPKAHVLKQLAVARDIALRQGYAVAIGHVGIEGGRVTAEAIAESLPGWKEDGIRVVFASEMLGMLGER